MATKFQQDALVHQKIPKQKKQGDSRIAQLISLAKGAGVMIDNAKTLYAEGGGFKGLFKKIIGSKQFRSGLGELAAYGAGVMAEGASGGGAGVLAGLSYEAAEIFGKHTGTPIVHSFKPGEWVGIDNGEIRIKKAIQRGMDWSAGTMFQDFPIQQDHEIETDRLTSIGFVVCDGEKPGTTRVFNFETGEKEDKNKFQVVSLPKQRQVFLNANKSLQVIKRIVLHPDPPIPKKLRCDVPCDPGEEVVYQKNTYQVVTCDGTHVRITDGRIHFDTNMSELTRGRVKHTNAWNYGAATDSGFDADSRSKIHAGQWIWIAPRHAVLCVRIINGIIVDGYYALDGQRFQTHISQVHTVLQERQSFLDQMKGFREFKRYAVSGSGLVRNYAPGRDNVLLCTGQASLNKELLHPGTNRSFMDSNYTATPSKPLGNAPDDRDPKRDPSLLTPGEVKRQVAESMAKEYGIPRATAHQMVNQSDAVKQGFFQQMIAGNGSGLLMGIAVAAVFVALYASR